MGLGGARAKIGKIIYIFQYPIKFKQVWKAYGEGNYS